MRGDPNFDPDDYLDLMDFRRDRAKYEDKARHPSSAKAGDRIRLIEMPNDPCPIEPGTTGTVTKVHKTSLGTQLWVDWDSPRSLMLIEGTDRYEVIESQVCRYCRTPLHLADDDSTWVDDTDGDCCSGDDNLNNENEPHIPA